MQLQQADAHQAHVQAGGVHHHEHGVQALVRFAHQPAGGVVKAHHAGGAAVQAHLFFDAPQTTALRVPRPSASPPAFGSTFAMGTRNSDRPWGPPVLFAGKRASTRCTMLSVRSCSPPEIKILLPFTRALPSGWGTPRVHAPFPGRCRRVGFGQAHGGQPFAIGDLLQVLALSSSLAWC